MAIVSHNNDHDGNNNNEIKELIQRIIVSFEPSVGEFAALMDDFKYRVVSDGKK